MSEHSYRAIAPTIPCLGQGNTSLPPITRQVLSKDKWEELKPLIRRLYIDENKPFRKISALLQESHGFAPTKAQFQARTRQWGYKKNVSRTQRSMMLQHINGSGSAESGTKVVKQSTRERWRKELQKSKCF